MAFPLRRVLTSTPLSVYGRRIGKHQSYRNILRESLECGHTVDRPTVEAKRRRCAECLSDNPRTAWERRTAATR